MIDKKKVVIVGTALVIVIGCNVFAKSRPNLFSDERGDKRGYLKAQSFDSQNFESGEISGDTAKLRKQEKDSFKGNARKNFENLTDEEKLALEERRNAKKEKFENLTDEEKQALKESKAKKLARKTQKSTDSNENIET